MMIKTANQNATYCIMKIIYSMHDEHCMRKNHCV